MNKFQLVFIPLILSLFITSCTSEGNTSLATVPITFPQSTTDTPMNQGCIKSFQEFAYTFWDLRNEVGDVQVIVPSAPWKIEAAIPYQQTEGYYAPNKIDVALTRSTKEGREIWIEQRILSTSQTPGSKRIFTIYEPASHSWKNVSANIEETEYYVSDLFISKDGGVWGSTTREYYRGDPAPADKVPVLSKFNEHTQRFEFATGVLEIIPMIPNDPKLGWFPYFAGIDIVLDRKRDIFWIFAEKDGIYRYEPNSQVTQKWLDQPDLKVYSRLTLSSDGSIFVEDFRPENMTEPYFHLYEGSLFQFFPDTRELVQLKMPDEPWPSFSGWLVTQQGLLWLGAVGYLEPDGSWHLLHPDPADYFKSGGEQTGALPYLMLESSDGRLWYQKFLDMGPQSEGTAWYNPETGEGCMFTNLPVNIIEDSERQLWLVAGGNLYRYSLNP
jgi:hypothetical protein